MDVAAAITGQRAAGTGAEVGAVLLRKALDQQVSQSEQLLQVLPAPTPPPSLEPHLGRSIDVYG